MTSKKTKSYTIKMLEDQDDREDLKAIEDTEKDDTDESETDTDTDSEETTDESESETEDTESMFEDSNVIEVTDKDFDLDRDEVVVFKKRKPSYVMVYSSSCPHCQNKKELYSKLAKKLTRNGKKEPAVLVLAINVKDSKTQKLQEKLDVSGVPSFFETNEEGKLSELEEPLEVLNRSLKMKPEEVLDYRRQEWSDPSARQDSQSSSSDTPSSPSDKPSDFSGSSDTPSDSLESIGLPSFPSEPIKRPGFDFFGKERRTIPLSEMTGPPLVDALRAKSGTNESVSGPSEESNEQGTSEESNDQGAFGALPNNAQQLGGAKRNIKKILQQLSTKDLQVLSKEFNRTGGRNKDEIIHRLLN